MRRLLPLFLIPLLALGLTATPAAAATINSFTADGGETATVETGDTVELVWDVDVVGDTITASTSGPDTSLFDGTYDAVSSETVTLDDPGVYTFTITAADQESEATDEVTVTVADPGPDTEVTPDPITFPDGCTVLIPETSEDNPGVEYGYGTGNSGSALEAGSYDLADLAGTPGVELSLGAIPLDGYTFPDGFENFFVVTPPAECFGTAGDDDDDDAAGGTPTRAPAAGVSAES